MVANAISDDEISPALRALAGREVLYCPNPGNAGDCLIAAATFQVFQRLGVRHRLLRHTEAHKVGSQDVVVYSGGGNLTADYAHARTFLAACHARAAKVMVLPHTITGNETLLGAFGDNVEIILRDDRSFAHVERHAPRAKLFRMHDMAMFLDVAALRRAPLRPALPTLFEARKMLRYVRRRFVRSPKPGPVLNCFRVDVERTARPIPPDNFDVSDRLSGATAPEFIANWIARDLLRLLDRYEEIRTNRLHLGIAGALLGKTVIFEDNNYGKNRVVYDFSLRDRYPNVRWRD